MALFNTLNNFQEGEQVKHINNILTEYKKIDKKVDENQRLRELIHTCQNSLDKYNKKDKKKKDGKQQQQVSKNDVNTSNNSPPT